MVSTQDSPVERRALQSLVFVSGLWAVGRGYDSFGCLRRLKNATTNIKLLTFDI